MDKVEIVFWSQSGNTEAMAEAVADGVKAVGKEADVVSVDVANAGTLTSAKGFALGCPAMGDEALEETEMEPFVASIEGQVKGKTILLFGSYGWGDGQWMRDWVERMTNAGAKVIGGEDAICMNDPDDDTKSRLADFGKQLADL